MLARVQRQRRERGRLGLTASVVVAALAAACSHADLRGGPGPLPSSASGGAAPALGPAAGELDARFVADVQQAFAEYKAWGRVDDEMRWAPFLCRMPQPGRPTMSAAEGEGGHARKLYSLFARDHEAYVSLGNPDAPRTRPSSPQIVAKESYLPELVASPGKEQDPNAGSALSSAGPEGDHFHPYARGEDGQVYRASTLVGVYFVIEKPGELLGTDDGFVYGTVTPAGEVTSAGRVASCMGCHAQAKHGKLFGSPRGTP